MTLSGLLTLPLLACSLLFSGTPAHADPVVLVIGDSISAAYGLAESDGWVALAEQALQDDYPDIDLVNASISGDTTAGGLRRLPDALARFDPDVVVIELGGNDGLRAYPIETMRDNLESMVTLATDSGAQVVILGMMIPSNYGQSYTQQFSAAFSDASEATGAALVPFFLEPIATDRDRFQRDGIHPDKEAQPLLLQHALPTLRDSLNAVTSP